MKIFKTIICVGGSAVLLSACNPFESKVTKLCEDIIIDQLRSPSGYQRISVKEIEEDIPVDQYIAYYEQDGRSISKDLGEIARIALKHSDRQPKKYTVIIEYDAPNGYGALIRGLDMCEYVSGGAYNPNVFNVYMDGQNKYDFQFNKSGPVLVEMSKQQGKLYNFTPKHTKSIDEFRLNRTP